MKLTTSDINSWFHADGPSYEYLDEQRIVDLVSAAEEIECDKEEDANETTIVLEYCNVKHLTLLKS